MGALRRAGVWLGLVEDEDERGYDDRHYRGYGDDFADDEDDVDEVPAPRARTTSDRLTGLGPAAERRPAPSGCPTALAGRPAGATGSPARAARPPRSASRPRSALTASERLSAAERDATASRSTVRSITRPHDRQLPDTGQPGPRAAGRARERPVVEEDADDRRYAITTLHPTTYNEARTIGEHFRDGYPVIMNLTEMDESDAKRLVDFAAGLVFGLRGNFERVTNRVFLLSPANVQVTAEDKAKIAEGGFFNQS